MNLKKATALMKGMLEHLDEDYDNTVKDGSDEDRWNQERAALIVLDAAASLIDQYRDDCEGRLSSLEDEKCIWEGQPDALPDDINDQICHWQATIKQIDEVLKAAGVEVQP